jgi:hypothetical protein
MPTPETETQSVGTAAKAVAERASSIVRLELELAAMELKRKVGSLALGIVFGLVAALFLLFMLGFAFAAAAAGLATAMATWAALLIVTGILFAAAAGLGVLALLKIKRGTPPVPEQAIREAKLTTEALKSDGRRN